MALFEPSKKPVGMLTWETTVEAQALYARGWTKSAIARHLGINRRRGAGIPEGPAGAGPAGAVRAEVFAPFAEYARLRLADDPHLWAGPARCSTS